MYSLVQHLLKETKQSEVIEENKNAVYKYSSTQVQPPNEIAEKILSFSLAIPEEKIYTDPSDPSYGRELEPHITIKYGLETKSAEDVEALITKETKSIKILLNKVTLFEPSDKPYDVLKIDIQSDELNKLHTLFSQLPNNDTHPNYIPHLTLAYVKKGMGAEYVGREDFVGTSFEVDSFYFKSSDGSSKLVELPVIPYDQEKIDQAMNQFLDEPEAEEREPVVVEDETEEFVKGQDALPNMA